MFVDSITAPHMNATGYQFVHISVFSLTPSKKAARGADRKLSVRDVIAEAARELGASPHVLQPLPPVLLRGPTLGDLEREVVDIHSSNTDAKGRRLRKDASVLIGGVASYPRDGTSYEEWRAATLAWLLAEFGERRLRTVVEHKDERHPHVHFYVVNPDGGNVKFIHPGFSAARAAKNPKEQNRSYKQAMREFQDGYWAQVSAQVGMARIGPKRRRLSRGQWAQEQYINEMQTPIIRRAKAIVEGTDERAKSLKAFAAKTFEQVQLTLKDIEAREARVKALEAKFGLASSSEDDGPAC